MNSENRYENRNKNNNNSINKSYELLLWLRYNSPNHMDVCVCRTAKTKTKLAIQHTNVHSLLNGNDCVCACVCIVYTNTLVSSAHVIEISTWVLIGREWRQLTRDLHFNSYCKCMYMYVCCVYMCSIHNTWCTYVTVDYGRKTGERKIGFSSADRRHNSIRSVKLYFFRRIE